MPDKFWREFYGRTFEGRPATLYVGDRFWNVTMEAWSDRGAFTGGWNKLIDDLELDSRSSFVFSMAGNKCFEVSVFNHETGTEIYFKKIELIVLDDSIYEAEGCDLLSAEHMEKLHTCESDVQKGVIGDGVNDYLKLSMFDSIFNDIDDSKFDLYMGSLFDKEDATIRGDCKGKAKVFDDEERFSAELKQSFWLTVKGFLQRFQQKMNFDMILDKFFIKKNREHVDPFVKSSTVVSEKKLSLEVALQANLKCNSVKSVTNHSAIACRTRFKVPATNDCLVTGANRPAENISPKPKRKASRCMTSTSDGFGRKRSTVKRLNTNSVIQFTKTAESRLRLPADVASDLSLSVDNLCDVTIQNLKSELTDMTTRKEKSGDGYRYGFTSWTTFLKSNDIHFGDTLFFNLDQSRTQRPREKKPYVNVGYCCS